MILQELYAYYQRMSDGEGAPLPPRYWSKEKVGWVFEIDTQGSLCDVYPLRSGSSEKMNPFKIMTVPEHDTRTSSVKPFFLCDKASYLLGLDSKRGFEMFEKSRKLHRAVLGNCSDAGAKAVVAFFEKDNASGVLVANHRESLVGDGGFIVFRLLGDSENLFLHDRPAVAKVWSEYRESSDESVYGQCLVTGERAKLARLFPQVTGFPDAQPSGASLVSFNQNSFESYGKAKGENSPISEEAAFGAGTALRYLLKDPKHRFRLGDTTVIFWADQPAEDEDTYAAALLEPDGFAAMQKSLESDLEKDEASFENQQLIQRIGSAVFELRKGKSAQGFKVETKYYILGLAPNAARLSIRFFEICTLGELEERVGQYLRDIEMIGVRSHSLRGYLNQTASLGKADSVPSTLICSTMTAMLTGRVFPQALYTSLLSRMRCDHASNNVWDMGMRAAMMKACLVRRARIMNNGKEEGLDVSLNKENTDSGYVLGRLFAVLEKTQQDALGGINTTICDRYIGAASTTPARIFPQLMRSSQNHMGSLRKKNVPAYINLDRRYQEVTSLLDGVVSFPKTLNNEEQGCFFIGYYQQKYALWHSEAKEGLGANVVDATKDVIEREA